MNQSDNLPAGIVIRPVQNTIALQVKLNLLRARDLSFLLFCAFCILIGPLVLRCLNALPEIDQLFADPLGYLLSGYLRQVIEMALLGFIGGGAFFFSIDCLDNQRKYWIAVNRNSIVGYVSAILRDDHSVLTKVYVHPPYRHQGIGSFLIRHLAELGAKPIYTFPCTQMQKFYKQLGFVTISRSEAHREMANGLVSMLILR
jgi:ribosomal protein S18 acetylase RimI-like enzyme